MSRTAKEDGERRRTAVAGPAAARTIELCGGLAFELDDRARVVAISGATRELLGLEPAEIVGTDVLSYIHPDDRADILSASIAARAEGRPQEVETRCARAGGGWRTMRGTTTHVDGRWYATALPLEPRSDGADWEAALAAERERLRQARASGVISTWDWDLETDEVEVSSELADEAGIDIPERPTLESLMAYVEPGLRERIRAEMSAVARGERESFRMRFPIQAPNAEVSWVESSGTPLLGADGRRIGVRGLTRDVTREMGAAAGKGRADAFTQATLDALDAQIAVIDAQGEIIAVNRAWREAARAGGAELHRVGVGANYIAACEADPADEDGLRVARALRAMLDGSGGVFVHEYACPSPAGERWFELRASHVPESGGRHVVIQHLEVTDRRQGAERLRAARDYFRAVADSMGEGLFTLDGDGRLIYMNESAERILGWRAEELAGRTMHEATHFRHPDGSPHPIAECPLTRVRETGEPVRVPDDVFVRKDGRDVPVEYTGAAFELTDGERGVTVVFEDISERKKGERELARRVEALDWLRSIRDALAEDRFVLHSQPIVDLRSGEQVQQELLIRMRNGSGLILPDRFLPPAEEYGLVAEIDRWVLEQAGRLLRAGQTVHVNVSARSIATGGMLEEITDALEGADPSGLVVELTETVLLEADAVALDFARGVRELGARIALDDFGTGFGGFSYLKRLPVDLLKIDREFVADLRSARASRHVVEAVVALAQAFGYRTVAEGVEDEETLRLLRELGVDLAQGFHIARPAPLEIPGEAG